MRFGPARLALSRRSRAVCWVVMLLGVVVSFGARLAHIAHVSFPAAVLLLAYSRNHPQNVDQLMIQWRSSRRPAPPDVVDRDQ